MRDAQAATATSFASPLRDLESALAESEERFRQLVETAYEGIWQVDVHGKTIMVNRRMAEMLGYSPEELREMNAFDVTHPDDHELARGKLRERSAGRPGQHDWRFIRKDGSELWCIVCATPTRDADGVISGSLGMLTDITERKLTELHLRRISRMYAVSSSVNEAIFRVREAPLLYKHACRIAVEQGELKFAWIAIREQPDRPLQLIASCGANDAYARDVMDRVNASAAHPGPAGRALRNGEPAVSNDIAGDPTFHLKDAALSLGLRSCAVFPLLRDERPYGIFAVYSRESDFFSAEEMHVLAALANDISFAVESSRRQRALHDHERMIATLWSNLPGMAYRCKNDVYWTMEAVSSGCLDLTGYSEHSLLDNRDVNFAMLIHPADRDAVRRQIDGALAERAPFELTYRITDANGLLKWVWERGTGIFDTTGELRFLEGFITDVTARKAAESKVNAQAALLDKATDAIVVFGLDDSVHYWNRGAERLYGWSASEVHGHGVANLTGRDIAQHRALIAHTLEVGEWQGELLQRTRADSTVTIAATWTLLRDSDGRPHSILTINTDITKRKQMESQLLTTQRLESIGTLAGGIAHDFNNILTAITGNAKLALDDIDAAHPLYVQLREIEKAGLRATDLVRQILTFSRRQEPKRERVQLRAIVAESLRLLRATLPAQIEIRTEFCEQAPAVMADVTQLHQVLINLGTNAAHAMRHSGGTLSVKIDLDAIGDSSREELSALAHGRYARLTLRDTGEGMTATARERIFEPFFTTKPQGQGTGLGLSVVHGIVSSHDGAIVVASEPGIGTTVRIWLPEARVEVAVQNALPIAASPSGQHILYVDDEEALVFLTTRILERQGYRVTGRCDARQALSEFRDDPAQFDAVVSDLSMPGMTGPELARAILSIRPDIPVVLTSGYLRDEDVNAARNLGIRELVLKPNTVEELGATVHRVLNS